MKPFTYTNCKGAAFHIHTHKTRKGIQRFTVGADASGALTAVPEGYEILEDPNGRVSIARRNRRLVTDAERQLVASALSRLCRYTYRVDVRERDITVHSSAADCMSDSRRMEDEFADAFLETLEGRFGSELARHLRQRMPRNTPACDVYLPLLRFHLLSTSSRKYRVQRIYFKGDSDWLDLETMPLPAAIMKYIPHLGSDRFLEMIR